MGNNVKLTWHTEKRRLGDLIEWDKNPRQLKEHDAEHLKKSLDNFGVADPLIINTDNRIIGGHMRRRIMLQSGYKPDDLVDVRVPDRELTEREVEELNIRLNKNTGAWDFDLLVKNFELDNLVDWGFDNDSLLVDNFTYKLSEYTVKREPKAFSAINLFGCYSACVWSKNKSNDYEEFLKWKSNPSELKKQTAEMANDVSHVIELWARNWRGFVITAPPQGISFGGDYPAGILAKEVANNLNVDFVTIFEPWNDNTKSHSPFQSLMRIEPPKLIIKPDLPVLIVDDMITSGNTAKLSMEALQPDPCWVFAWMNNSSRPGVKKQ